MGRGQSVYKHLLEQSARAVGDDAEALLRVASRFGSFVRIPESRDDCAVVTHLLTALTVPAIGAALIASYESCSPHAANCSDRSCPQEQFALAAVLTADSKQHLRSAVSPTVERLLALTDQLDIKRCEHAQYLAWLFSETHAAEALHLAAQKRLANLPATDAERWARSLGLNLPLANWQLSMVVPAVLTSGRADANLHLDVKNEHGAGSTWSIRIGAAASELLGASETAEQSSCKGEYRRDVRRGAVRVIEGSVRPAKSLFALPRVLAEIERTHPKLRFDRLKISLATNPEACISRQRQRHLIAWLHQRR